MPESRAPEIAVNEITVNVNGAPVVVPLGATAAVAMAIAGAPCRKSISGEPRGPLCGMGICFECRAVIDGVSHARSCQVLCREGLQIATEDFRG